MMTYFAFVNNELKEKKDNLISLLKETIGKKIKYGNGNEYTIKSVDSKYIDTVEGKVFSIDNLDVSGFDASIANSYNQYFALNMKYSNLFKNMKYLSGTLIGTDVNEREHFFDKLISELPYDYIDSGNKRKGDPHYLNLNVSDKYFKDNCIDKNSFYLGVNIADSRLATFVIVDGVNNREEFIKRIKEIIKYNNISSYVIEQASLGNEDGKQMGIRIHHNLNLYKNNYEISIDYLKELIKDTLYLIKETNMFSK